MKSKPSTIRASTPSMMTKYHTMWFSLPMAHISTVRPRGQPMIFLAIPQHQHQGSAGLALGEPALARSLSMPAT
jgi:hypothetical protein